MKKGINKDKKKDQMPKGVMESSGVNDDRSGSHATNGTETPMQ